MKIKSHIYKDSETFKFYDDFGNFIDTFIIPDNQYDDYIYCSDSDLKEKRIIDLFNQGVRVYNRSIMKKFIKRR